VGSGVVSGLEVRLVSNASAGKAPVLAVSQGLGFNRQGIAVSLPQVAEVMLAKDKPDTVPESGFFDYCQPPQANGKPLPGKGVYLFVIRPAIGYRGQAPRRGFGQTAKVEGCDRDLVLEGVQFRLVPFDINTLDNLSMDTRAQLTTLLNNADGSGAAGLAAQSKLRNWLANACFGTEELASWLVDPFQHQPDDFFGTSGVSAFRTYGLVDKLEQQELIDDCDVPLALICWTRSGVKWADMWSVRRRLSIPYPSHTSPMVLGHRRQSEGEAALLEFEELTQWLLQKSTLPELIAAADYFRWLPPVGLLPVKVTGFPAGFSGDTFFGSFGSPGTPLTDGALLRGLLNQAVQAAPIDLAVPAKLQRYRVYENVVAAAAAGGPQPYLVFAGLHLPSIGVARFGYDRWNQCRFANQVV
jgi:hypothetical protein